MGSREHWDGAWVWPEGLAHYVECHDVCLPEEFVQRAVSPPVPQFLDVPAFPGVKAHWDYWLDWVAQFES